MWVYSCLSQYTREWKSMHLNRVLCSWSTYGNGNSVGANVTPPKKRVTLSTTKQGTIN